MDDDGLILELDSMELESFPFNSGLDSLRLREVWTSTPRLKALSWDKDVS